MVDILICSLQRNDNATTRYAICPCCGEPSTLFRSNISKIIVWDCCQCDSHFVIDIINCKNASIDSNEIHVNKILRHLKNNSLTFRYRIGLVECRVLHVIGVATHECCANEIAKISPVVKKIEHIFIGDIANIIGEYCKPNNDDIWKFVEPLDCVPKGDMSDMVAWYLRKFKRQKYYEHVYGIRKLKNIFDAPQIFLNIDCPNLAVIPNIRIHLSSEYWTYIKCVDCNGDEQIFRY